MATLILRPDSDTVVGVEYDEPIIPQVTRVSMFNCIVG